MIDAVQVLFPLAQKMLDGRIRSVLCHCPSYFSYHFVRDGDSVTIRVSKSGQELDIQDNHLPDATIESKKPILPSTVTEDAN
jgi:hypothetical protein